MSANAKTTASIRLPDDIWALIDEIGRHELWNRSLAIQESVKFFAKEKGIAIPDGGDTLAETESR